MTDAVTQIATAYASQKSVMVERTADGYNIGDKKLTAKEAEAFYDLLSQEKELKKRKNPEPQY